MIFCMRFLTAQKRRKTLGATLLTAGIWTFRHVTIFPFNFTKDTKLSVGMLQRGGEMTSFLKHKSDSEG